MSTRRLPIPGGGRRVFNTRGPRMRDAAGEATGTATGVLLGLGANLGDPVRQLRAAVHRLEALLLNARPSSLYRSAPVDGPGQPDFLNLVVAGETRLCARELLAAVQHVEAELGRTRPFRNAPRTIDIDLLAYGDLVVDTAELTLPHPRLHQRGFVLAPLAEIAPHWRHPLLGSTAAEMLHHAEHRERVARVGPLRDR